MISFKCAIFDLDGTILDSTDVWNQIDIEFFSARGMTMPENYGKIIAPMGFERAAEYTVSTYGLNESPEEVVDIWSRMSHEKFRNDVLLKPGAKEYLKHLKKQGITLCIATASQEDLFVPALENNGIFHFFDYITTLSEVSRGKGFPDIYIRSARKAGFRVEECVVFEDLLAGVQGAKDGGFYTVAMYDKNSEKDIEEIKKTADKLICNYNELI